MALNVPVGCGILAYRFRLTGDPEEMVITCGFEQSVGIVGGGQALVDALYDAFVGVFPASSFNNEYDFVGATIRWRIGAGPELTPYEHVEVVEGTEAGAALPNNCAYLVRKLSAQAGRKGKGRMYVPPMFAGETQVDSRGVLTPLVLTGLTASFNALFAAIEAEVDPLLLHSGPGATLGGDPTPITSFAVDSRIATRRLRLRP